MQNPTFEHEQRRHSACKECRRKKLRCDGQYPACSRCVQKGTECTYAVQKPMGRPRKRRCASPMISGQDSNDLSLHTSLLVQGSDTSWAGLDFVEPQSQSEIDSGLVWPSSDEFYLGCDANTTTLNSSVIDGRNLSSMPNVMGSLRIPSSPTLTLSGEVPIHSHPTTVAATTHPPLVSTSALPMGCACLSSMYLSLSSLQAMKECSFPAALHTLREAISAAVDVLNCQQCPKKAMTALHNSQLLGIFCMTIAERYHRILDAIEEREKVATRQNTLIAFEIGDLQGGKSHLHLVKSSECLATFKINLQPTEWRKLVKRVVKSEVLGGNTELCCPTFMGVLEQLESRQLQWHAHSQIEDLPKNYRMDSCIDLDAKSREAPCLRLPRDAKKMIGQLSFE